MVLMIPLLRGKPKKDERTYKKEARWLLTHAMYLNRLLHLPNPKQIIKARSFQNGRDTIP